MKSGAIHQKIIKKKKIKAKENSPKKLDLLQDLLSTKGGHN